MKGIPAIKQYFGDNSDGHGRKVTMDEMKALSPKDRRELGELSCKALGVEYEPPATKES
jgi:hypothetical protein